MKKSLRGLPAVWKEQLTDWLHRPVDRERVTGWSKLHLGAILLSVGIYFFKFPNHFTTGGVSGISIVLHEWIPAFSTATVNLILNAVLLLIGLAFLGTGFGIKTAYVSLLSSVMTLVLEAAVPMEAPLTDQPVLELFFAVGLPAVGSALLFDTGASSGGTDIIAMIVRKYSGLNAGTALILADFVIAAVSCFVFDWQTGLFSIVGLLCKGVLVDYVADGLRSYRIFTVITAEPQAICDYIIHELHHSATVTEARGAFTGDRLYSLMTVVNRGQALHLQQKIKKIDPHCFITVSICSHIVGKGFRSL